MSDIVLQRDVGSLGSLLRLSAAAAALAGGAGNATTTTGVTIDRAGFGSGSLADTVEAAIAYEATLQSGKTLSFGFDLQQSPDGVNFTDYVTGASVQAAAGPSGGGAVGGQAQYGFNLRAAQRYVRFNFAPSLNATGTDTAVARAVGFFAGFDRLPQGPG